MTSMTQQLCKIPSVRLKDGRDVDYNYLLSEGHAGIVELAGASFLPGASQEEIANITAMPFTAGDDIQDVMLGAYNVAVNNDILSYPSPSCFTDSPAIVVGSAPSLTAWLPIIRKTYGEYLIVASASAVRPLVEAGIIPHIVAPKERTKYPYWCFDSCPDTPLYAGLAVVPNLHIKFPSKWCIGDSSLIAKWADCEMPIATGPSSGTHAMSMALLATSGTIYLVGMDNCGGHFNGYLGKECRETDSVLCHDGVVRGSQWIYRIARENMQRKHENRCVQLCDTAAIIDGIALGNLLPGKPFSVPQYGPMFKGRMNRMRDLLRTLPYDWDALYGYTQTASRIEDTQLTRLDCHNKQLFHALLTPLCVQLSMERRLGMKDADAIQWYKEATCNMIDTLSDTVNTMATIGGHYG